MSTNFSSSRKPLINYSLAGLADIVLLLLVFFLLTSSFIPQFGVEVTLPQTQTAAPTRDQHVTVIITADGTFYVEQRQVIRTGLMEAIQSASLNKTSLVLRADEESKIKHMAAVGSIAKALNLRFMMATDRMDPNQGF